MDLKVAEAAVSFAVEKLGEALINKVAFLRGVEGEVNLLKDELEMMYGFLQDATQKQATNNGIRVWISQIRQVAHDVEDVIETFTLKIDTPRTRRGMLVNCACFPRHVNHLDKLGKEIESIRARLKNILESRAKYGIEDHGEEHSESGRQQNIALQRRRLVPQQKDKDVVGFEKHVNELLVKAILNDRPGLSIARITGIGGLGKSTLAREVYNHADVVARFKHSRAWVVVSEDFDAKGVIMKLLQQLGGDAGGDLEKLSLEELKGKLLERLNGKQYLIVLDDVWRQQHWELLKDAFPDEQEKKSRLLVTSRTQNVPNTARFAIELQPLDSEMSWQLFLKKSLIDDTNGRCPPELEDIGRKIVEKCGGLPLGITVVGGLLLSERRSRQGWARILNGLDSDLSTSENRVSAVLELSYHNLPPQLKSCFLCLGFFRKDVIILAEKLVQVWIAEGLISQEGREEIMDEIASGYLDELINQNIVQVKDMTVDDQVEICQIHDLLHDLSINKAKEEIGFEMLKEGIHSQSMDKSRHHAIYWNTKEFNSLVCRNSKHIRSLFFHRNADYIYHVPSFNWKKFVLLRILDFPGFGLRNLPDAIGTLIGLRYLGLRGNLLRKLPISLGCLVNLQVLDILWNPRMKVSDILWKLESLRHLYMSDDLILDAPLRLDTLKNLQTLVCYHNGQWMWPKHIMEMTNLRKLHVSIREEEVSEFISSLAKLKNLVCLHLAWEDFNIPISKLDVLSTLRNLTELWLWGKLALPFCDIFPPNLSQLTLCKTEIDQDSMQVLEKLPNLLYLNLEGRAYVGRKMVISDGGFPSLRVLCIERLKELRKIELVGERRGMPQLKRFKIKLCDEIESLPERMTSLQELEITGCPKIEALSNIDP